MGNCLVTHLLNPLHKLVIILLCNWPRTNYKLPREHRLPPRLKSQEVTKTINGNNLDFEQFDGDDGDGCQFWILKPNYQKKKSFVALVILYPSENKPKPKESYISDIKVCDVFKFGWTHAYRRGKPRQEYKVQSKNLNKLRSKVTRR